jgi:hypothetical protein
MSRTINCFNMIEVALAMAIIAFGMTSILGLFPVGLNASRAAIAENSGSDAVEQLGAYIKSTAEFSTANFDNYFKTNTSSIYLPDINTPNQDTIRDKTKDFLDAVADGTAFTSFRLGNWQLYKCPGGVKDIYFVLIGPEGERTYDFAAMVRVWKTPVTARFLAGSTSFVSTDTNYDYSAGINFEISWPLEKNYYERDKRYFYLEANRP